MHRWRGVLWLVLSTTACAPSEPASSALCDSMRDRCGDDWAAWCSSDCVPEAARTRACAANDACLLCGEPEGDEPIYFGVPSDLTYLWTAFLGSEIADPTSTGAATGAAFDDGEAAWRATTSGGGSWRAYEPYDVAPGEPMGFCEPGPNQFLSRNVTSSAGDLLLSAQRATDAAFCDYTVCVAGPYPRCDAAPVDACQYGDSPETSGTGDAAQVDRRDTHGFGRYRSVHGAGTDAAPPSPGFDYAFFAQSNAYCVDGRENPASNTGEIDIEITSGTGSIWEGGAYCDAGEMCVQLVNWVSSSQGVSDGEERRATSAFRFRSPEQAAQLHTWGWDWSEDSVRFTCDADPSDCDEAAGACPPERASIALCEHRRFVPRRPATLHLQLWNAWWAGHAAGGTRAQMRVHRIWHIPR